MIGQTGIVLQPAHASHSISNNLTEKKKKQPLSAFITSSPPKDMIQLIKRHADRPNKTAQNITHIPAFNRHHKISPQTIPQTKIFNTHKTLHYTHLTNFHRFNRLVKLAYFVFGKNVGKISFSNFGLFPIINPRPWGNHATISS